MLFAHCASSGITVSPTVKFVQRNCVTWETNTCRLLLQGKSSWSSAMGKGWSRKQLRSPLAQTGSVRTANAARAVEPIYRKLMAVTKWPAPLVSSTSVGCAWASSAKSTHTVTLTTHIHLVTTSFFSVWILMKMMMPSGVMRRTDTVQCFTAVCSIWTHFISHIAITSSVTLTMPALAKQCNYSHHNPNMSLLCLCFLVLFFQAGQGSWMTSFFFFSKPDISCIAI